VPSLAALAHAGGALVHTDAAQAVGRIGVDVRALDVDLLSCSAHKLGGPTGIGVLFVRRGVEVEAQVRGGPQERGRRAGTENVIGIAGFGAAARVAREGRSDLATRVAALRDRLWQGIRELAPETIRNGSDVAALPNTLNVTIPGVPGESALVLLDVAGIAISIGSACAAGAAAPSHVLLAMGRDRTAARSGLRFSLGWTSTAAEVDRCLEVLPGVIARIRSGRAA
jgi:cysteine desulfurase